MRQPCLGGRHQVRPPVLDQRPAAGLHQHRAARPGRSEQQRPMTVQLLLVRHPDRPARRGLAGSASGGGANGGQCPGAAAVWCSATCQAASGRNGTVRPTARSRPSWS
ncbi:hypothetical protein [Streptomyces nojiriensis]|uniref:hypothetical protein n=1 Tax=Streptomyces nojiriensis TaxID=66374 RepID=UPI00364B3AEA